MEDTNIFKDPDWVLGDMAWFALGGTVILGLLLLNAYVQRIARNEERQRIERLSAENLKRERLAAAQSRRPDNI
jgi:quinol-cytochrome oxidoreductase complex cytochrome b subunit